MPKTHSIVAVEMANISSAFDTIRINFKLHAAAKLDYDKLVSAITLGSDVVEKTVYLETRKTADQSGQQKFHSYFKQKGFRIVTKELKEIHLVNGGIKNKANFDVEITTDICRHIWRRNCNEIIILSGDSDFAYLIDMAKDLDIKVTIVSSQSTISRELRERADRLILLDNLNITDLLFIKDSTKNRIYVER